MGCNCSKVKEICKINKNIIGQLKSAFYSTKFKTQPCQVDDALRNDSIEAHSLSSFAHFEFKRIEICVQFLVGLLTSVLASF